MGAQDLFRAITCFLFDMTDMGWHKLDLQQGVVDPARQPGFVKNDPPGCLLLPDHTRVCFVRADEGSYVLETVRPGNGRGVEWVPAKFQGVLKEVQQWTILACIPALTCV